MAGQPKTRERITKLEHDVRELEEERDRLKGLLALHAPQVVIGDKPEPLTEWSDDIPAKVLALGEIGMTEDQMIAEMGVDPDLWMEWRQTYSQLPKALSRARVAAKAYYEGMIREAVIRKDWSFPHQQIANMIERRFSQEKQGGDASDLIRLDGRLRYRTDA